MDKAAKIALIDELFKREKSPGEEGCLAEQGYCLSDMCEILHHKLKHLYDDAYTDELLADVEGNHYYWGLIGLSRFKKHHNVETPEELKPLLKRFLEDPHNGEPDIDDVAAECYPEIEYEWVDVYGLYDYDSDEPDPTDT
ncbi:hypothetical protein [Canibacter oris]|uniref:Uncharacterized protein n=1 Tax=Canibacter oris TaxID=1365628 RepID=A0A840DPK6_9MICO|nr:hypothetical protein [Canibacter oris]MBB4072027.1 hypothetical protein [Canibacter oris]